MLLIAPGCEIETTLLVCPAAHPDDFAAFAAFLQQADVIMTMQGIASELQVVGFHPEFIYSEAPHEPWDCRDGEDPCSYTNRAPHPMIHLLRQASVREAVEAHPDARSISVTNERLLRKLGLDHVRELLWGRTGPGE